MPRTFLLLVLAAPPLFAQAAVPAADTHRKTEPDSSVIELTAEARKLSADGRQDDALATYDAVLKQAPNYADAHLGEGIALDLLGKYTEARGHIRHAISIAAPGPAHDRALRTMAVSYAFTRNAALAAAYEQQVIDAALARKDYETAADVGNEMARIFLESGDPTSSYTWYQRAHATALRIPDISPAARDLWDFRWEHAQARIASRRGQAAAAWRHVAAAKEILDRGTNREQRIFYPYLTGYVAYYTGDYNRAIAELAQADHHDPFILSLIAQAYEKTGDRGAAADYYRQILFISTHNPPNAFARPLAQQRIAASPS